MVLKITTGLVLLCVVQASALAGEGPPASPPPVYLSAAVDAVGVHFGNRDADQSGRDLHVAPPTPSPRQAASAFVGLLDPNPPTNSASAGARAGFGWLSSNASASVSSQPPLGSPAMHVPVAYGATTGWDSNGLGAFYFSDTLTVNAPGLAGKSGVLHASVKFIAGTYALVPGPNIGAAAHESAGAQAHAIFGIAGFAGDAVIPQSFDFRQSSGADPSGSVSELVVTTNKGTDILYKGLPGSYLLPLEVPFVFGKAFGVGAAATSFASASVNPPELPTSDPGFPFTRYAEASVLMDLFWNGISSVTLASPGPHLLAADPLAAFTVSSFSGADYRSALGPVPEPSTWVLWLVGLLALCGLLGTSRLSPLPVPGGRRVR
jgi:hypothetical protein